jgi:glycosyltransferase involved in cell wall biosynthesis
MPLTITDENGPLDRRQNLQQEQQGYAKYDVIHIIHGLTVGGAETDLVHKSIFLHHHKNWAIQAICLLRRGDLAARLEAGGVPIIGPLMRSRYDLAAVNKLRRIILETRPPILHSHLFAANLFTRIALLGIPPTARPAWIASEHAMADRWSRPALLADRWIQSAADCLTVPSQAARQSYGRAGLNLARIRVIPNAVDPQPFRQVNRVEARSRLRRELNIPAEAFLIGSVGRLIRAKNYPLLIEAVSRLPVYLVIAGDGPERARLAAQIASSGISDRVFLTGAYPDIPALLAAVDAFVLPSESESFGLVIIEALLMDLPVIAAAVGGILEATGNGEYADLVPPGDLPALAAAIAALRADPEGRRQRARLGRDFAIRNYGVESASQAQVDLYNHFREASPV